MSRGEAWLHHLSNLAVGGSGLAYAWMLYLVQPAEDEFGFSVQNHPWQDEVLALHLVTAPALVFALGLIWRRHVWARIRSDWRPRRRTGVLLALLAGPMILSGPLLQTAVSESWQTVWRWLHVGGGLLWCAAYLLHQLQDPAERPAA